MDDLRVPPQDLDAERHVLGSCAVLTAALDEVASVLTAGMFYSEKHAAMWSAMCDMRERNKPVDAALLADELAKRKQLEMVGGARYIMEVLDSVPHAGHALHYAEQVREKWRLRTIANVCTEALRECFDAGAESEDTLVAAESGLAKIRSTDDRSDGPSDIGALLVDVLNSIGNPNRNRTVTTTFERLDFVCGGFPICGLTYIGATKSSGKTALIMSIAVRLAESMVPTLIVSYEQPRLELAERALACMSGISCFAMQTGRTTQDDNRRLVECGAWLDKRPLFIDDACRSQAKLAAMIRGQVRRRGIKVVMVDYLQRVQSDNQRLIREQQIANLSWMFKQLAMELKVAMVVASQLNRQCEINNREPELYDLRESGSLEQDGDLIWLLFRPNRDTDEPKDKPDDFAVVKIAKHRNGPTGRIALDWNPATMTYRDIMDMSRADYLSQPNTKRRHKDGKEAEDY